MVQAVPQVSAGEGIAAAAVGPAVVAAAAVAAGHSNHSEGFSQ